MLSRLAVRSMLSVALLATAVACDERSCPVEPSASAVAAPAAALDAEAFAAALRSGDALFEAQRLEEAELVAARLVERAPESWEAAELAARIAAARGVAAGEQGDEPAAAPHRTRAADEYQRAARLAGRASLWHAAGVAASVAGRHDDAIAALRRAAELDPALAQAPLVEAQVHLAAGALDDAEEAIARAAALRPEEPFILATRAEIARQRGEPEEALRLVRQARRLAGADPTFRATEARMLRQLGRPRDAVELLLALEDSASAESPAIADELARGWLAMGEPARAAQAWAALVRRSPRHWRSGLNAADAWLRAGDVVRADAVLREVELVAPLQPDVVAMRQGITGAASAK